MQNLQLIKSERFGEVTCDFYSNTSDVFMTANQLGEVLEYSDPVRNINKLVSRNDHLKEVEFSTVVKLTTTDGKQYGTRVFTEDGIYEVTMLSRTEKAKEFRAWVRKILKSIRTGQSTLIDTGKLNQIKVQAQQDRAKAMLLNAQNRALKTLMTTIKDEKLSPIAVEVFGLKSIEQVTGVDMGNYLPQVEHTYTATEIGGILGITSAMVGRIANKHGLKTDEYGVTVMDKSRHSSKEVPSFRYYEKAVDEFKRILNN